MDKNKVQVALKALVALLPKPPTWAIIINESTGDFIARIGEYIDIYTHLPPIDDDFAASHTNEHILSEDKMLDELQLGRFQWSASMGSNGMYILIQLNHIHLIGLGYFSVGVRDMLGLVETVYDNLSLLIDVL